jgi:hypothetical protein
MSSAFVWFCSRKAASADLGIDWSVLSIVLVGVVVLMLAIRLIGVLGSILVGTTAPKQPTPEALPARPTQPVEAEPAITPELIAVLTAAAAAVLGGPVRIDAISVGKMAAQRGWSQEGRREIYLSHRIR